MLGDIYRAALRFGMTKRDYFNSTPNDVNFFIEEKTEELKSKLKRENDMVDYVAWLHGAYVARAVGSVLSKKGKYPKEPLSQTGTINSKQHIHVTEDMSDSEKAQVTDIFFGNLIEMQQQFERTRVTTAGGSE